MALTTMIKARSESLLLTLSAIFVSLVFVVTSAFSIYIPQTEGFFNIGESVVYLSALIGGPYVGAISGGLGSMLADLFLGYPHYAPGTLVIKASEGFVVGYLAKKKISRGFFSSKAFGIGSGVLLGAFMFLIGTTFYTGDVEIWHKEILIFSYSLTANEAFLVWSLVSLALVGFTIFIVRKNPKEIWTTVSIVVGGVVMVLGYFLYEQFIYGILVKAEIVALAEVPFNFMQMLVGMTVATYIYKAYRSIV